MKVLRWTAAAVTAVLAGGFLAASASANNVTSTVSFGGQVVARATWTDVTDNLCVTAIGGGGVNLAGAKIRPANGSGPSFTMSDLTDTSGGHCTGNLSIPEDRAYILTLTWSKQSGETRTAAPKNFYT